MSAKIKEAPGELREVVVKLHTEGKSMIEIEKTIGMPKATNSNKLLERDRTCAHAAQTRTITCIMIKYAIASESTFYNVPITFLFTLRGSNVNQKEINRR